MRRRAPRRRWLDRRPLLRLSAPFAACIALASSAASCSLVVDTRGDQCAEATVGNDCSPFPGLRSCERGVCTVTAVPPACTSTAECSAYANAACMNGVCSRSCARDADCGEGSTCTSGRCGPSVSSCERNADCASLGATFVCRKDTRRCVNLTSADCGVVYPKGAVDDDAFIFGSVLPIAGDDGNAGIPLENSIELAIDDFAAASNGLPPAIEGGPRRPLVLVGCNDGGNADTAVRAAHHLAYDVGVPAIVGAAFSGITIKVFTDVALPTKTMLFSPSATSAAITTLDTSSPRLLWRTAPPDGLQAQALSLYMNDVETKVRADNPSISTDSNITVTVLYKGDAYGKGLADTLAAKIKFNGGKSTDADTLHYFAKDYGNPDDPTADPPDYDAAVAFTLGKAPHVIFIFGTDEGVTHLFENIESNWPSALGYKPRYVFSDGGEVNTLWSYKGMTDELRRRVSGTVPGAASMLFDGFINSYKGKFGSDPDPNVFGTAGAYDIVYLLAFGAVSRGSEPLTGSSLASGMASLVPAPPPATVPRISAGSSADIGTAFAALQAAAKTMRGGPVIDFDGASGPLDFDVAHGEAPSEVQIWCMPADPTGAGAAKRSGYYYTPDPPPSGMMSGSLNWSCQ